MQEAVVRGVLLNYRIIGDGGDLIALTPGARRSHDELVGLSERIAAKGYRVLLHDRRNCGRSEVAIEPLGSEHEIWADDLSELCNQLGEPEIFVGGASAGARLAIMFALRHPRAVRGLLLWRLTGGKHAAEHLAREYYGNFIDLARSGGMPAVCNSEYFATCIKARPGNREKLMGMSVDEFIRILQDWREAFIQASNLPVIGATEDQLRALTIPACVIPGNDRVHTPTTARTFCALVSGAELHDGVVERFADGHLREHWDPAEWSASEPELARIFVDFLDARVVNRASPEV